MTEMEEATKLDYGLGCPPDQVYAGFCRMMEALNGKWEIDKGTIAEINRMPLVLFEAGKANKVLDWIITMPITILFY